MTHVLGGVWIDSTMCTFLPTRWIVILTVQLTTKYQESFGEKLERSVVILWALVGVSLAVPILLFFLVFFPAFRKVHLSLSLFL